MTIANPIYDAVFKYLMEDESHSTTMERNSILYYRIMQFAEYKAMQKATELRLKEIDRRLKETELRLKEIDRRLKETELRLKAAVRLLLSIGASKQTIAQNLHTTIEEVEHLST